jgi:hypothetical protein
MATVEEIEHAIRALSPDERIRLAHALPALIPELDGDVLWEASARASAKRPSLSAALDELDALDAQGIIEYPLNKLAY